MLPSDATKSNDREALGFDEFQEALSELRPLIGNYDWMWRVLSIRARRTGWFPRRLHAALLRLRKSDKPYFIGQTAEGISFLGDYRDEYSATCMVCPDYDSILIEFMRQIATRKPGQYLDIGTNLGVVAASMAMLTEGKTEVLAFEPMPQIARRTAATFALNGLRNVRFFPIAVGDTDGDLVFYEALGHSEWSSAHPTQQKIGFTWAETRVPQRTLDSLWRDGSIQKTALIKIDVEGHEPAVARGAQEMIAHERPDIIYEYNSSVAPQVGWTADVVAQMVNKAAPYRFQTIHHGGRLESALPAPTDRGVFNIYGTPI